MTAPRRASTIFNVAPGYELAEPTRPTAVPVPAEPVPAEPVPAEPVAAGPAPVAAVNPLAPPGPVKLPRPPGARRLVKVAKVATVKVAKVRVAVAKPEKPKPKRERSVKQEKRVEATAEEVPVAGDLVIDERTVAAPPAARPVTRRTVAGQVLRSICTLFALVLAVAAALLVAEANTGNHLVTFVQGAADHLDLAVFDVDNGVMKFTGDRADLKNALFNRGIAALVWLFIGRTVERVVVGRPTVR